MRLANPYALLLLFLVPLLLCLSQRWRRPVGILYPTIQELAALPPSLMARLRRALPVLRALVLILGILALARPQWSFQATKIYTEGIAIDMVVDVSRSMRALELQPDGRQSSRLNVIKEVLHTFVQGGEELTGRNGDLIGMVIFARYADGICPLTLDHDLFLSLLDQVAIVTRPEENGTAIGEAIILSVARLRDSTAINRVVVLLTDGSNNAGDTDPLQAAQIAKALGVKIYTIGTGTRGFTSVAVRSQNGRMELRRMPVSIDEATLTQIATISGGRYFRATDGASLRAIYAEIDRLEKSPTVAEHYQQYAEAFPLFLLPGLGLLLLEVVLVHTCFRTIP